MQNYTILYLAAGRAKLNVPDNCIVYYQDINGKRDIDGDMMDVDITDYDILIATPPCNYYSRANQKRDSSQYSIDTKHLLPAIIDKFEKSGKPYIVENVINRSLMGHIYDLTRLIYFHGRHTYFTNRFFNPFGIHQERDFKRTRNGKSTRAKNYVQGGRNVNDVIEWWIKNVV